MGLLPLLSLGQAYVAIRNDISRGEECGKLKNRAREPPLTQSKEVNICW